jgi:hypothetical protein
MRRVGVLLLIADVFVAGSFASALSLIVRA